jgi:processive 1,2-diacylglycerol beta-glucosyltransferase
VDRYFVPDEFARRRLEAFGQPPEAIELSGIPVHPKWDQPVDPATVYADWNLPPDRPIVLLAGGVEFTVGAIDRLGEQIAEQVPEAFVLVLAGGNKHLLNDVAKLPCAQGDAPRLRGVGFTDRLHELASVASLFVTKAGGLTTAECLTRGTPMVLLKPVPGQEAFNAEWLVEEGAAVLAKTNEAVIDQVRTLLRDPAQLQSLRDNARRLARPSRQIIVDRILAAVANGA